MSLRGNPFPSRQLRNGAFSTATDGRMTDELEMIWKEAVVA
jgi:hypothetical protein